MILEVQFLLFNERSDSTSAAPQQAQRFNNSKQSNHVILYLLKTLHIIGFVAWFGGLFYFVRILVYHQEAMQKDAAARAVLIPQYQLMEGRVKKIIMNPAMIFTWICGMSMLALNPAYLQQTWMPVKLFFLILLTYYHCYCLKISDTIDSHPEKYTDLTFRILNEIPTILLAIIVSLAVFRTAINYYYLAGGITVFVGLIVWGILAYRKRRAKEEQLK